jgi:hypothetical protein
MSALSGVRFAAQIESAARAHGLDPRFLAAVAAQETGGPGSNSGANVVGDGGHGRGVFQIDDRWHAFARTRAAMEPAKNADYAAGMLSGLLSRYRGDARAALSAYNAGSPTATGTLTTWGDGTRLGYAESVLRHYTDLGGDPAALGEQLVAGRADAAPAANALAGLAAGATLAPAPGGGATTAADTGAAGAAAAGAAAATGANVLAGLSGAPATSPAMRAFQVTLPQPAPYPTQFRSYTSVSGMDGNRPQQVDAEMTGLIDGADGLAVLSDGTGG